MMKLKTSATFAATVALLMGLLVGCTAPTPAAPPIATEPPAATEPVATVPATTQPATSAPPVAPTAPAENTPEPVVEGSEPGTLPDTGAAVVENVEVRVLESFPVQVQAVVTGYLPDGCTTISGVEVVSEGTTFRILIATNRPADAMCTMALVNFEQVVPLDTAELPAGTYQVVVNDLSVDFELPGGGEAAAQPAAGENSGGENAVVETTTAYVMAQVDVPMFDAPMAGASEIGMIAGGQMARVTGASPDGAWWRVICPDDTVGDCWVTAAPDMTVPATPPN